jgi:hypothetical protein
MGCMSPYILHINCLPHLRKLPLFTNNRRLESTKSAVLALPGTGRTRAKHVEGKSWQGSRKVRHSGPRYPKYKLILKIISLGAMPGKRQRSAARAAGTKYASVAYIQLPSSLVIIPTFLDALSLRNFMIRQSHDAEPS